MPEFIDPFFAKTSPKRLFSISENERFGLVFAKTGSVNSGTGVSVHMFVHERGDAGILCALKEEQRPCPALLFFSL